MSIIKLSLVLFSDNPEETVNNPISSIPNSLANIGHLTKWNGALNILQEKWLMVNWDLKEVKLIKYIKQLTWFWWGVSALGDSTSI